MECVVLFAGVFYNVPVFLKRCDICTLLETLQTGSLCIYCFLIHNRKSMVPKIQWEENSEGR
jgi:hypothetical protein